MAKTSSYDLQAIFNYSINKCYEAIRINNLVQLDYFYGKALKAINTLFYVYGDVGYIIPSDIQNAYSDMQCKGIGRFYKECINVFF